MTLSYLMHPFSHDHKRKHVRITFTTEQSASSYGQPVMVLPDGEALDLMSWVGCGYRVVRATQKERAMLRDMGLS